MEKEGYREILDKLEELFPGRLTISVKEAAAAMDAQPRTVYEAIARRYNALPAKKLSKKKIVIPIPAFARYLADNSSNNDKSKYIRYY